MTQTTNMHVISRSEARGVKKLTIANPIIPAGFEKDEPVQAFSIIFAGKDAEGNWSFATLTATGNKQTQENSEMFFDNKEMKEWCESQL